ncbi:MAG: hypothetical protein ABL962_11630 [Fimbriimonadaceae bacterium]
MPFLILEDEPGSVFDLEYRAGIGGGRLTAYGSSLEQVCSTPDLD